MRRWAWTAGLVLVAGCATANREQVREYNEVGVSFYQRGDFTAARDSFIKASTLKPDDPGILFNLGQAQDRLGNDAEAERLYNDVVRRDANHAPARHALAALLVRENRSAEAIRMTEDWLRHEPKRADAYAEDGWLWRQTGDLPRAQARLQQALNLDAHNARALTELAQVYEQLGRTDRALVLYERCLEKHPEQSEVRQRVQFLTTSGAKRPQPEF